jgi:hypothetical protein
MPFKSKKAQAAAENIAKDGSNKKIYRSGTFKTD